MIVDYTYYVSVYMGEPIMGEDFPRAETKAERLIKTITHGRSANYDHLPEWQQAAIRDAICAQVEYYALNGTEVSVAGETAPEWSVGKVHVGGTKQGSECAAGYSSMVCPAAFTALEQTGLLNSDVAAVDYPPVQGWWL